MYIKVQFWHWSKIHKAYKKHKTPTYLITNQVHNTLSSQSKGRCSKISNGTASAAMTITSAKPLFKVLVARIKNKILCSKNYEKVNLNT